jgi:hypothetical protein
VIRGTVLGGEEERDPPGARHVVHDVRQRHARLLHLDAGLCRRDPDGRLDDGLSLVEAAGRRLVGPVPVPRVLPPAQQDQPVPHQQQVDVDDRLVVMAHAPWLHG